MNQQVSSAGVVKDYINGLVDGAVATLEDLVRAVHAAGIDKDPVKIYADVQSLASRRQIGRGDEARTYCKVSEQTPGREERKVHPSDTVAARKRSVRANGRTYSSAEVLDYIHERLGPPRERSKTEDSYAFVLLGDWSGEYLLERATTVLGEVNWYALGRNGHNPVVYFYR